MTEVDTQLRLRIVVDDREGRSGLPAAITSLGRPVEIARLRVGDVAIGDRIVLERKTAADFAASIIDHRLFDQAWALRGACARPLLVLEGDDADAFARLDVGRARGALASLLVSYGIPVLRTASVEDTAGWIVDIAAREQKRLERIARSSEQRATARTALDVLDAIPGIGPWRAAKLVETLGSPRAVFNANERTLRDVPGVGRGTARAIREAADGEGRVCDAAARASERST